MKKTTSLDLIKTKCCEICRNNIVHAFRVRISKAKPWIFTCKECCEKLALEPDYQYGGTWKSKKKS